ncbi:hypothetical protein F3F96_07610 [Mariprofundus sp. NF]|uniref:urate hydroxylase PuuD n=1 Tax=Mariprofundus sp. NF TaxID=2608716 RepID=UPI0015A455DD|nr:urate hydroxylase PuuD [Mariprofundus sp. NF]NWF38997.1 hypothetical protein [Mariprofundus sp. NF]
MKILLNHRLTIIAGFALAAILVVLCPTGGAKFAEHWYAATTRWGHFLAGITWIGILYYFNFIQAPFLKNASAETKAEMFSEGGLVRNALWWFRWSALVTLILGLSLYGQIGGAAAGWDLRLGAGLGIVMCFNVWFIIWPAQKKVVGIIQASAEEKLAAAKNAMIASRINTLLSIPMLFFMASSAHFPIF